MMSTMSPGGRLDKNKESKLHFDHLSSRQIENSLQCFLAVCRSCYGPSGHLKMIHNKNGYVSITSSSARLLRAVSSSTPVIKLLSTAILDYIKVNFDGGLFVAIFASEIILSVITTGLSPRLVGEVYEYLLNSCIDYLKSPGCPCKWAVSWDTSHSVLPIVRSIVGSKPGSLLANSDVDHLSRMYLEAFLRAYTVNESDAGVHGFHELEIQGRSPGSSFLTNGIFIETPQFASSCGNDSPVEVYSDESNAIRIALVNVSMAGESDEFEDALYQTSLDDNCLEEQVKRNMHIFCSQLAQDHVGILVCQKVVHPTVKRGMKENRVLVLDRLGLKVFNHLLQLTGGSSLSSFQVPPTMEEYGKVRAVKHTLIDGKSHVHLIGDDSSNVFTMVVCNRSEEALAELKTVGATVLNTLKSLMYNPYILCGGGCWQIHIAGYIRQKCGALAREVARTTGCSYIQANEVINVYCHSLVRTGVGHYAKTNTCFVEETCGHLWVVAKDQSRVMLGQKCQCGTFTCENNMHFCDPDVQRGARKCFKDFATRRTSNRPVVCDVFQTSITSLKSSVSIANVITNIHQFIQNEN